MKIIDDVMPVVMQDQLIEIVTAYEFTWGFLPDATYAKGDFLSKKMDKPKFPAFNHLAMNEYRARTSTCNVISSMLLCMSDKAEQNPGFLYRARFGLYLPIQGAPEHNNIHTDMKTPHTVALYYVNDADGDTFFFDRNREVINRVTPKKGRMVVFDGLTLHASSMPSKDYRISLNLGYVDPKTLPEV